MIMYDLRPRIVWSGMIMPGGLIDQNGLPFPIVCDAQDFRGELKEINKYVEITSTK